MDYCLNCTRTYTPTPEEESKHQLPCQACGSGGHSACQH